MLLGIWDFIGDVDMQFLCCFFFLFLMDVVGVLESFFYKFGFSFRFLRQYQVVILLELLGELKFVYCFQMRKSLFGLFSGCLCFVVLRLVFINFLVVGVVLFVSMKEKVTVSGIFF